MSETKKAAVNPGMGRYDTVILAKNWIDAVKDSEEFRGWGQSEMVKQAIDGVRAGNITPEMVDKAIAARKKAAAAGEEGTEKKTEKEAEKGA